MWSLQLMFSILQRQLFSKARMLFSCCCSDFQHSSSRGGQRGRNCWTNSISVSGSTFIIANFLTFHQLLPTDRSFLTCFSRLKVLLACRILNCTFFSFNPVRSTLLPRYQNSTTWSTELSPHYIPSGESLFAMLFILSEIIFSPNRLAFSRMTSKSSWSLSFFTSIRVMSSAKSRSASRLLSHI